MRDQAEIVSQVAGLEALARLEKSLSESQLAQEAEKAFARFSKESLSSSVFFAVPSADALEARDLGTGKTVSFHKSSSLVGKSFSSGKELVEDRIGRYSSSYDARLFFEQGFRSLAVFPSPLEGVKAAVAFACERESFGSRFLAALAARLFLLCLARIRFQEKERELEKIVSASFESARSAKMVFKDGKIFAANKPGREFFGFDPSGKSLADFFSDAVAKAFLQAAESGAPVSLVTECLSAQGKKTVEAECVPSPGGYSLLELAEVSGLAQEMSAREVLENAPDLVFSLDEKGVFSKVSGGTGSLGFPAKELLGQPAFSLVFPPDLNAWNEALQEAREGLPVAREIRLFQKNGKSRFFEASLRFSPSKRSFYGVLRDVHDAKETRQTEALLQSLIATSSDAIYYFDSMGTMRSWNKSAEKVLGFSEKDVLGRDVRLLYPPDLSGELDSFIHIAERGEKVLGVETQRMKKNGERAAVLSSFLPLRDSRGKSLGFIEVLRDITALKELGRIQKARKDLEDKNRQLLERAEAQSMFISNVSHELRTPLTSIHGYSQLLLEGALGSLGEEQKDSLSIISTETQRLTRLINDVLDLSKIDSEKLKLAFKEFDLRDLEEKCALRSLAEKKGLFVKWIVDDNVPLVMADANRISQVLINLVSNAIKFTEKGGVTIRIAMKSKRTVLVEVIDTGIGIPLEEKKNIFKRFYQVYRKDATKVEGTGLGLNIARGIVALHGGKLDLESKVWEGSRFWFTLPVAPREGKKKAPAEQKPAQPDARQQPTLAFQPASDAEPEQPVQ